MYIIIFIASFFKQNIFADFLHNTYLTKFISKKLSYNEIISYSLIQP